MGGWDPNWAISQACCRSGGSCVRAGMMTAMALSTRFTEMFGARHPIALAPMGGSAGGALTAAVSRGGGLGILGAGNWDPEWMGP